MLLMGTPWGPGSPGPPWHPKTNTEAKYPNAEPKKTIQKLKKPAKAKNPNTEAQKTNTDAKKNKIEAKKPLQKLKIQIADGINGNPLGPWEPWTPLAPKNQYRS